MTRLQELLNVLSDQISIGLRDDVILENFDNQDATYYEIDGQGYYIFDRHEVTKELMSQYEEDVKDFTNFISSRDEFRHIVEEIYLDEVAYNLASSFEYKDLNNYEFVTSSGNYYIYKEL